MKKEILAAMFTVAWPYMSTGAEPAAVTGTDLAAVTRAAMEMCRHSSGPGKTSKFEGKGSAEVKAEILKMLMDAGVGIEGAITSEEWDGIQQPLREHQFPDNESYRACTRDLVPQLLRTFSRPPNQHMETAPRATPDSECKVIGTSIGPSMKIHEGICFANADRTYQATIKTIYADSVVYSNHRGKDVTCRPGDTCSFGWPNSPIFSVNIRGPEVAYIANAK